MYLILHNNRLYSWAASYNALVRYGAVILLPILVISLWHSTIYNYLKAREQSLRHSIDSLKEGNKQMAECLKKALLIENLIESMEKSYKKLLVSLKPESTNADRIISIIEMLDRHNLILVYSSAPQVSKKEDYTRESINYTIEGTFCNTVLFLDALKKNKNLILCNQISLERKHDNILKVDCVLDFIVAHQEYS